MKTNPNAQALIDKNEKMSAQDLNKMGYVFSYGLGKTTKVYTRETDRMKFIIYWNFKTEQMIGIQQIRKEFKK